MSLQDLVGRRFHFERVTTESGQTTLRPTQELPSATWQFPDGTAQEGELPFESLQPVSCRQRTSQTVDPIPSPWHNGQVTGSTGSTNLLVQMQGAAASQPVLDREVASLRRQRAADRDFALALLASIRGRQSYEDPGICAVHPSVLAAVDRMFPGEDLTTRQMQAIEARYRPALLAWDRAVADWREASTRYTMALDKGDATELAAARALWSRYGYSAVIAARELGVSSAQELAQDMVS